MDVAMYSHTGGFTFGTLEILMKVRKSCNDYIANKALKYQSKIVNFFLMINQ